MKIIQAKDPRTTLDIAVILQRVFCISIKIVYYCNNKKQCLKVCVDNDFCDFYVTIHFQVKILYLI